MTACTKYCAQGLIVDQTAAAKRFSEGERFECPSCGALLPHRFRYSKLIHCDYCQSLIALGDGTMEKIGEQATLAEYPALFELYQAYRCGKRRLEPIGKLRYDYGRGFWDEWWCLDQRGGGVWVSVDEGDFAIEQPVAEFAPGPIELPRYTDLSLGTTLRLLKQDWRVTELGDARFVGLAGEVPDPMDQRRAFRYAHLERPGRHLITLEYPLDGDAAEADCFVGTWVDPFEINPL
jgi:hypothetical protein